MSQVELVRLRQERLHGCIYVFQCSNDSHDVEVVHQSIHASVQSTDVSRRADQLYEGGLDDVPVAEGHLGAYLELIPQPLALSIHLLGVGFLVLVSLARSATRRPVFSVLVVFDHFEWKRLTFIGRALIHAFNKSSDV